MAQTLPYALEQILKETSRAFYLSLRVLPPKARLPLSLAYLIARAADTVADCEAMEVTVRLATLKSLQAALVQTQTSLQAELSQFRPKHPGEQKLLHRLPQILALLTVLKPTNQRAVQKVVKILIDGMIWDQELFEGNTNLEGLGDEQLERYTYLVAGCVGSFWTQVCSAGDPSLQRRFKETDRCIDSEFGKALQWVNILRDIPEDQQSGRYYLPPMEATNFEPRFRRCAQRALRAFDNGSRYVECFPVTYPRYRLAALWPLLLGLRTMELLLKSGGPQRNVRIKVSRMEVFWWLAAGPFIVTSNRFLTMTLSRILQRAQSAYAELEMKKDEE